MPDSAVKEGPPDRDGFESRVAQRIRENRAYHGSGASSITTCQTRSVQSTFIQGRRHIAPTLFRTGGKHISREATDSKCQTGHHDDSDQGGTAEHGGEHCQRRRSGECEGDHSQPWRASPVVFAEASGVTRITKSWRPGVLAAGPIDRN